MTTPLAADESPVGLRMAGTVAVITMRDEAKRNALSRRLIDGFHAAMDAAIAQGARAVVLASSARVFCAGGDLSELVAAGGLTAHDDVPFAYDHFTASLDMPARLLRHPFPVIAAVDGAALGGGFELTLCCDGVLASPRAFFALPEAGLGLVPSVALTRLPPLIGKRRTLELALTQRRVGAEEALALGLVSRIVDSTKLVDAAIEVATAMVAKTPPAAAAAVKAILAREMPVGWRDMAGTMDLLAVREWKEGLSAFLERRAPDYASAWDRAARAVPPGAG